MHSQIIFGSSFHGCLDYVLGKPGAQMVGTNNLAGTKIGQFTKQFQRIASRSTRLKKPVMHVDFSPHPDEGGVFTHERIMEFAANFFEGLGMENCQWVLVQHNDTVTPAQQPRPHFHAVANRIPIDQNKAVNSSWIGRRCQQILRDLRAQFGLKALREPEQVERKPMSVGQYRRLRREQEEYEQGIRSQPPELPVKVQLQDAIDELSTEQLTLPELTQKLRQQGIEVRINSRGISYAKSGVAFSGTQLGRAYTINGLAKYRGISSEDNGKTVQLEASASSSGELETSQNHLAEQTISEQLPISPQVTKTSQNHLAKRTISEQLSIPSQVAETTQNHLARKTVSEPTPISPQENETSQNHLAEQTPQENQSILPQVTETSQNHLAEQTISELLISPQETETSQNHLARRTISEPTPVPPQATETSQNHLAKRTISKPLISPQENEKVQKSMAYQSPLEPPVPPQPEQDNTKQLQQQWALTVTPIIGRLLDYYHSDELDNGRYTINRFREDNRIVVERTDEIDFILGVDLHPKTPKVWSNQLEQRDLEHFLAIEQQLDQLQATITTSPQKQELNQLKQDKITPLQQEKEQELDQLQQDKTTPPPQELNQLKQDKITPPEPTVTNQLEPESTVTTPPPLQIYQQLNKDYGIPMALSAALFETGKLDVDNQGEAVFVKEPLGGQVTDNPAFWISTGKQVEKAIITDSPIEAISAFLIDYENPQPSPPTVYLSIEQAHEFPMELTEEIDEVVVGIKEEKLASQLKKLLPDAQYQNDTQLLWNQLWLQQLQVQTNQAETEEKSSRSKQNQMEL